MRGILDPGLVSLVAELRGHERQTAEDWTSERPASSSNARRLEAIRVLRLVAEELASISTRNSSVNTIGVFGDESTTQAN